MQNPHCIVICGLSDCTTLFHIILQTAWFSKKSKHNVYWLSPQPGLKHFKYIQRHIVINVRKSSWKVWLFWEFLFQLEFSTLMLKKTKKSKVMNVQPVWAGLFLDDRQTWRKQNSFPSIYVRTQMVHTQNFIHNIHTKNSLRSLLYIALENYLIVLNKLTSKGAVKCNINMYGRCGVCGLAVTYINVELFIKNMQQGKWEICNLCKINVYSSNSTLNCKIQGKLREYLDCTDLKCGVFYQLLLTIY
jgi:hypothetical protein